jgi:hypothetical protein
VIWFYAREGKHLRCELRPQAGTDRYELAIALADGSERIEVFADAAAAQKRARALEQEWLATGWDGPFSREL